MTRRLIFVGSIGAGVLLILALFPAVVSAQKIKSNERQMNILQQIKEKMKDNDWKHGDILNIKLKDLMKDSAWFPGMYLFSMIFGIIILFAMFIGNFF